ncbi:MAG: hypothetical protein AB2A00_03240 [Myxococcota bacterium]
MSRLISFFIWRMIPIFAIIYAMRGSALSYSQCFRMLKSSSFYMMSYINMGQYVSSLEAYARSHRGNLPDNVHQHIRDGFQSKGGDPSRDPWGTPYVVEDGAWDFTLRTCGVDRKCPTADDLSNTGGKQRPRTGRSIED